jgi:hypothetical protein
MRRRPGARSIRPTSRPERASLRLRCTLGVLAAIAALVGASPAAAEVRTVGSQSVGLQPRSTALYQAEDLERVPVGEPADQFTNAEGRPVVSSAKVYAIYWDPTDTYHGNWQKLVNTFFSNMAAASGTLGDIFAVDTQYTDGAGQHATSTTTFAGAYTDTDPYPQPAGCADPEPLTIGAITCLSGEQVEAELERFIAGHSLPKGMGAIYYLLTPPGVTDCLAAGGGKYDCSDFSGPPAPANKSYEDSFCSYHSAINPGGAPDGGAETVLYAAIPWTAGTLGDAHVFPSDLEGYECQDGGWEPKAPGAKSAVESRESESVQQEPNQDGMGPDGSYDAGLADLVVGQIATEQQNILTDPLLNAWQTHVPAGKEGGGEEATDLCRDFFALPLGGASGAETESEKIARVAEEREIAKKLVEAGDSQVEAEEAAKKLAKKQPHHGEEGTEAGTLYNEEVNGGHYYLNDAFNLAAIKVAYPGVPCLKGVSLEPSFTAPENVNAGEVIGFDGMESNITLDAGTAYAGGKESITYPTYEWSFGDGTSVKGYAPGAPSKNSPQTTPCELPWLSPCAASAFHSYAYGGEYAVTLTVTDVGGNVATLTKTIDVSGPPPPSGSSTPSSGASSHSKAGKSALGKVPLPRPVASAIVDTRSLGEALHNGLPVRYSVNQEVAGHFEVLLPTRLAKHLHIKGRAAKGLAPAAAPQTVIAYALLVTIRKAHGTLRITIPPPVAKRLSHMHEVTLTLRLVVRNADRGKPKDTLLQTVVRLHR